jgi:uncharacterized integral membrane protein
MSSCSSATVCNMVSESSAAPGAGKRRWERLACYLALAVEFVWIVLLFIALVFAVGDTPYVNTPDKSHFFNWLSSGPAAVGVLFGVIGILLRLPVKIVDWIFLIAGSAGCAGLFYLCTKGIW